jgi:hypothetical protein
VKKILLDHGGNRRLASRFASRFRSHGRFEAEFCTPAEAHEITEDVADLNR